MVFPMKRNLYFHIAFACLFMFHLASINYYWDTMRLFSKPLICVLLILFLYTATGLRSKFDRLIGIGLLFGLFGDVFLMLPDQFIPGLASFLIGHVFYVWAFMLQTSPQDLSRHKGYILIAGLLLSYSYYFYSILKPSLGAMEIPVIAYILVIAAMAFFAFTRKHQTNFWSFILVFLGALLFIFSDSMLAINKFVAYVPDSGLIIMSSYMLAQYFITVGAIRHRAKSPK